MNDPTTRHKATGLEENNTFDILITLGKEVRILVLTSITYINDAQKANRSDLVNM